MSDWNAFIASDIPEALKAIAISSAGAAVALDFVGYFGMRKMFSDEVATDFKLTYLAYFAVMLIFVVTAWWRAWHLMKDYEGRVGEVVQWVREPTAEPDILSRRKVLRRNRLTIFAFGATIIGLALLLAVPYRVVSIFHASTEGQYESAIGVGQLNFLFFVVALSPYAAAAGKMMMNSLAHRSARDD